MYRYVITHIYLYDNLNDFIFQELQVCTGVLGHPSELYEGDSGARFCTFLRLQGSAEQKLNVVLRGIARRVELR